MSYRLIPLEKRQQQDISPCELGWEECLPGHTYGPAIRDHYLVHYVVSGEGEFCCAGKTYPVRAGEIFVIRPGEITVYAADKKTPWHYIWIGFSGGLAERFNTLAVPVLSYPADTFSELRRAAALTNTRTDFVTAKIFEMMSVLFETGRQSGQYEQQVMNFIHVNYMNPITVDSIAEAFNLNRRYLSRVFKARTGLTVSEYLIQTRLQHGAAFLQQGYSVSQAAVMAGYQDQFNFSKMFKKAYGLSPTAYCRNNKRAEEK